MGVYRLDSQGTENDCLVPQIYRILFIYFLKMSVAQGNPYIVNSWLGLWLRKTSVFTAVY